MQIFKIGKVEVVPLTNGHEATVSSVVVQVYGITADSGSMTPQLRISMEGQTTTPPPWGNCWYKNLWSGTNVAAGTAITADGEYEFQTDGSFLAMNVTAVTNGWQCFVTPLEGPIGSNTTGGGSGGAVTIADGADVALGSKADAPVTTPSSPASVTARLAGIESTLQATPTAAIPVTIQNAGLTGTTPLGDTSADAIYVIPAKGTLTTSAVSVTSTATLLQAATSSPKGLLIYNNGTTTIYVGSTSGVTTATGIPVPAGQSYSDSVSTSAFYGICTTGSNDVRVGQTV
jgi:hypothetical protein